MNNFIDVLISFLGSPPKGFEFIGYITACIVFVIVFKALVDMFYLVFSFVKPRR